MKRVNKIVSVVCLLTVLAVWSACHEKHSGIKDKVVMMQSRPVALNLSMMECRIGSRNTLITDSINADLRLVVYVDSSQCSPCMMDRMHEWNRFIDDANRYGGRLKYVFVVAPRKSQLEDAYLSLEYSGLKSPVYVDTAYCFRAANPGLPAENMYHTFLLNSSDSVLLVGNPLDNKDIERVFNRTVKSIIY